MEPEWLIQSGKFKPKSIKEINNFNSCLYLFIDFIPAAELMGKLLIDSFYNDFIKEIETFDIEKINNDTYIWFNKITIGNIDNAKKIMNSKNFNINEENFLSCDFFCISNMISFDDVYTDIYIIKGQHNFRKFAQMVKFELAMYYEFIGLDFPFDKFNNYLIKINRQDQDGNENTR